jgi:secernin
MCDTILAPPGTTASGAMLFGKNSDRQRNEAQGLEYFARREYASGESLACTYIEIPQAARTHAVLLCRPFWIWGAEMGANEYGVTIGNEGLHAKSPAPAAPALIGMDLLRLALERANTAAEAVTVITDLLQKYGQGGNCGHLIPEYYNNGFIVADASDAFVLETVGRDWLLERVRGVRSCSNIYSIAEHADAISTGLPELLKGFGAHTVPPENYADTIRNPTREHVGYAGVRRARSQSRLDVGRGNLTPAAMMSILRDHGTDEPWHPSQEPRRTICAHATTEDRPGQTVGAMVSEIFHKQAVHWVTGTAAPCLSVFKPLLLDIPLPAAIGPRPSDRFNPETLWWAHERLHRMALAGDFVGFLRRIAPERDALEADFQRRVQPVLSSGNYADRARVIAGCWADACAVEQRWAQALAGTAVVHMSAYHAAWGKLNDLADVPLQPCSVRE